MQFRIWRLPLREFYRRNPQAPNIGLVIVAALLDNFRRHPVWSTDKRVLLRGQSPRELAGNTEVGELDFSIRG